MEHANLPETADNFYVILSRPQLPDAGLLAGILMKFLNVTRFEADIAARRCLGFVASKISKESAESLEKECLQNGIGVKVIPGSRVAVLPRAVDCARADFSRDKFTCSLNEKESITSAWDDLVLAGAARISEEKTKTVTEKQGPSRMQKTMSSLIFATTGIPIPTGRTKEVTKTVREETVAVYLELFTGNPLRRIRINPEHFNFSYLAGRKGYASAVNFNLMVADVDSFASNALKTRGFTSIIKKEPLSMQLYDSFKSFEKELTWLLTLHDL